MNILKQRKLIKLATLLAGFAALQGMTSASATDKALLDTLVSNGVITAEQAAQIASDSKVTISPNRGTVRELRIRGRIQGQAAYSTGDGDDDYGTMEIRRARVGVQGSLYEPYRFQIEMNTLPTGVDLDSAYLRWVELPEANIEFGKNKPRFGHEENTSSASILTVERTNLSNTLNGGKPVGLRVFGGLGMVDYYAGIFNGPQSGAVNPTDGLGFLFNASVGLNLSDMLGDGKSLALRADGLFNDYEEDNGYGFETAGAFSAHFSMNPFDLRLEYMIAEDFDGNQTHGFYIMPSIKLTSQLEAVARYEYIDADTNSLRHQSRYARRQKGLDGRGDEYQAIYVGANYYVLGNNLKYMGGAEFASLDGASSTDAVTLYGAVRMQF